MKYCGKLLSFSTPFTFQPSLHLLNYCAVTPIHVYCCIFQVLTPLVDKPIIFFHPQVWKILSSFFLTCMFLKGFWFGAQNEVLSSSYKVDNTFDIVDFPIIFPKHLCPRKWHCPWILALFKGFIIIIIIILEAFLHFHHPHWWFCTHQVLGLQMLVAH